MGVDATVATSRRGYLSQDELEQFADITVNDATEADDQISQAEEMIDSYVGYQEKFLQQPITGRASAGTANTLTLQSDQVNTVDIDYYKLCELEIIGGLGVGQRRKITGSTRAGVLTLDSNFTTTPDTTSFYKIYQLGKFPRVQDVEGYTSQSPATYYKSIPEAVKRAVAAQVEYIIAMGGDFFTTDRSQKDSESILDYSYTNKFAGVDNLIAPKAKMLLRGIKCRLGSIVA